MPGWPYVTRVDGHGVHRTGPWAPWRSTPIRAGVAIGWVTAAWVFTGSALLAGFAAALACWAWRATT